MLFQLGSSVVLVRVFCCFSLGLLLFKSGSSIHPPRCPLPAAKVGNRVAEKFRFFRFTFNKFQPKDNSVQIFHHLLPMQLICDGQWWLAESSEWWNSAKMWKKPPYVIKKWKTHFYITFNFWWLAKWSKQQKSTVMQKRSPKSSKNEMLSFGLCSISDDQLSDWSNKIWVKCENRPPKLS